MSREALDTFPREDLAAPHHYAVRAALLREVAEESRRRRRRAVRAVTACVVAAAVVVAAVPSGSVGRVLDSLLGQLGVGDQDSLAPVSGDGQVCGESRAARPADADGLRYLPERGAGWNAQIAVRMEFVCVDDLLRPTKTFVRLGPSDEVVAAVTAWRSVGRAVTRQTGRPVQVRGVTGALTEAATSRLTWVEPAGRQWSLTTSDLSASELVRFADTATVSGSGTFTQPGGSSPAWTRYDLSYPSLASGWMPHWYACLQRGPSSGCSVRLDVSRSSAPWQTELSGTAGTVRITTVQGRPAAITKQDAQGAGLRWAITTGVQAHLESTGPGPDGRAVSAQDLLDLARTLEPVGPDDPRLAG